MQYIPQIKTYEYIFPNPRIAPDDFPLAFGGDLSPNRLILAYSKGIFPWYNKEDPILWWSVNPRLVMYLDNFKCSKSLKKTISKGLFEVKIDTNFRSVMQKCSQVKRDGQNGTWIIDEVIDAYCELFEMGYAHSFESYFDGELVGGLYGISLGKAFFGESMFATKSDASKVAYAYLVEYLKKNSFDFIDCQVPTNHLKSLGAIEISRNRFLDELEVTMTKSSIIGKWS
jgi:leucyl/phenylalanyl-tRNA--protein transferase